MLDAGVHCDGRRADVTRTEAQLRVFLLSPVTPAMRRRWRFLARPRLRPQRPRGAHVSSLAFEGCLCPCHPCGRCAGTPALADLWCADLALNARAPLRLPQQPFIAWIFDSFIASNRRQSLRSALRTVSLPTARAESCEKRRFADAVQQFMRPLQEAARISAASERGRCRAAAASAPLAAPRPGRAAHATPPRARAAARASVGTRSPHR